MQCFVCQAEMSNKERTKKYKERLNYDHARRGEVLREKRKK